MTKIEELAYELFGDMRDATKEEQESINKYIESISTVITEDGKADENFFEKCRTCKHCYTRQDDDYVYCRKRNGKCEYKEYKKKMLSEVK